MYEFSNLEGLNLFQTLQTFLGGDSGCLQFLPGHSDGATISWPNHEVWET